MNYKHKYTYDYRYLILINLYQTRLSKDKKCRIDRSKDDNRNPPQVGRL